MSAHKNLQSRTAFIELLASGITAVRINPNAIQTVEDAKENISKAVQIALPLKCPLLVDVRGCKTLEADVRHYYSGQILVDSFQALCMLLDISPLGKMMGNLYLRVAKPGIPTHLTHSEQEAVLWLQQYVKENS